MKNDENSVNLSRRDFFKELGMIGGGGVLLSAFPWLQSCSCLLYTSPSPRDA